MKDYQDIFYAIVATRAAQQAADAAKTAVTLLNRVPGDWGFADQAYWLCRAAQKTAEDAADELNPEEALENDDVLYAFAGANAAAEAACEAADELVALAMEHDHEIRR